MGKIRTPPPPRRGKNFDEEQAPDKELIVESSADLDRDEGIDVGVELDESQEHLYHQDHQRIAVQGFPPHLNQDHIMSEEDTQNMMHGEDVGEDEDEEDHVHA